VGILAGILALQGDFAAHARVLSRLGAEYREVRDLADLDGLQALVIPGGESTTMSLLLDSTGLRRPLTELIQRGLPVLGTCAGAIMLARELLNDDGSVRVQTLGLLDGVVDRNAYGRQVNSFEAELALDWAALGVDDERRQFHGVFIRAPQIANYDKSVQPVAYLDDEVVAIRQGNIVAATFHPELSGDDRLHAAVLRMIAQA
jgi:5'-phosphate synthase pdxT subunit